MMRIYVFHIYVNNIVADIFHQFGFGVRKRRRAPLQDAKTALGFRTTVRVMTPRWEYRVWGEDLSDLRAEVVALNESLGLRVSRETYLVGSPDTNAKIRDEILDVKRLIKTEHDFELWTPTLKEPFPLTATTVNEVLAMVLQSDPPKPEVLSFNSSGLLAHARGGGVIVAEVTKRRETYRQGDCLLEFVDATINGFTRHTVAIESEELSTAFELAARLGISTFPNQSYPAAIRRTLQM